MDAQWLGAMPAHPVSMMEEVSRYHGSGTEMRRVDYSGLTKRELLAAMAMQAIASNEALMVEAFELGRQSGKAVQEAIAVGAVSYADALLAELAREDV